jgi:nucleobase:cation symporter-1, NCS1 family
VYLWLLDPVSLRTAPAFPYMTASVPSLLAAALVYLLLTRTWVTSSGRGGYGPPPNR